MSWWSKVLTGGPPGDSDTPDYYAEGAELLRSSRYHDALTSFRLALRDQPDNVDILQQMGVTYTRIGLQDEAVRAYRRALELKPHAAGAHYGLAFLLLQRGKEDEGVAHLRAFLARPPAAEDARDHIRHARATLTEITGESFDADIPADRA